LKKKIKMIRNIIPIIVTCMFLYTVWQMVFGTKEGIENKNDTYQEYDTSNPDNIMILVQQNAGNIEYLKNRMDEISSLKSTVTDLTQNVEQLNKTVEELVIQQQSYVVDATNGETPEISGL
jgi:hypothetical protein